MPLVLEDGSGVTGANSAASLAEALAFHTDRNTTAWLDAASDNDRTAALIKATDYVARSYTWPGQQLKATQGLPWPLVNAYYLNTTARTPVTGLPKEVKQAVIELAPLMLGEDVVVAVEEGPLKYYRDSAVVVSEEREYFSPAAPGRRFPFIDLLLKDIVLDGPGVSTRHLLRV